MKLAPRTLLVRTFLLVSLLICLTVAIWITLFALAEREPRARQLAQLTVSVANLTRAALVAAEPAKRRGLLRDFAEREGVHLFPAEPDDEIEPLPDTPLFALLKDEVRAQLGPRTRFAGTGSKPHPRAMFAGWNIASRLDGNTIASDRSVVSVGPVSDMPARYCVRVLFSDQRRM